MRKTIPLKIKNKEVLFADIIDSKDLQIILFCRNGSVFHYDCKNSPKLISNKVSLNHHNMTLYSHGNYICLVEQYNTNGYVLNLSDSNYLKKLERGDYCVNVCEFPIALYSENDKTFLIHGTDWNRLDITNLETDNLLTSRIVDDEKEINSFDYFHGTLQVSPNSKNFISNGWHWHPHGQIYNFSIESFMSDFEFSNNTINFTNEPYNLEWNRPVCWIDDNLIAIGFNKMIEKESSRKFKSELLIYDCSEDKLVERLDFNGFTLTNEGEVKGSLYFDSINQEFIALNKKTGLLISDITGKEIHKDSTLTSHNYSSKLKMFYHFDYKHQLMEITDIK